MFMICFTTVEPFALLIYGGGEMIQPAPHVC